MKKLIAVLVSLAFVVCLVSCGNIGTYDDGFEDGYDEGYLDAKLEFEDDYSHGYKDGCNESYCIDSDAHEYNVQVVIEAAEDYAREHTGWSVYEAWNSIGIYHDGVDPDGFDLPTEEEYRQCVDTLVLYCEYLEGELP